ncbi:hypothetical protein PYW08_008035 [Mythimna loreyi]|uniref:Uncharacterized protein n=1 Tax=Mythimna loreyi TaxID=667449 RepID=A0ACC2QE85_9NEOP|nr:hypothetical protein PYW08_008035 [Mythimna loreyi]
MSFLGRTYKFVKQENFDGFLLFAGAPPDRIEQILKFSPDHRLVKDGDTYTNIIEYPDGPKVTKFKSGEELDDVIGPEKFPIKTTYTVDGDTVIQTILAKPEQGKATFKREYSGDDLVVTITMDKWDGVSKRYYKAA